MMSPTRLEKFLACKHYNVQSFTEYCMDCGENRYISEKEILEQERKAGNVLNNKEEKILHDLEVKGFASKAPENIFKLMTKTQELSYALNEALKAEMLFNGSSIVIDFTFNLIGESNAKKYQLVLNDVHPNDLKQVEDILNELTNTKNKELIRQKALAKLTSEDMEALGLNK